MCEHICPTSFKFIFMWFEVNEARYFNPLEFTLFSENSPKFYRLGPCVGIPVKVYDIIKVTRARSLCQCTKLFGKSLDVVIGQNDNAIAWCIAIGVKDRNMTGGSTTRSSAVRSSLMRGKPLIRDETGPQ